MKVIGSKQATVEVVDVPDTESPKWGYTDKSCLSYVYVPETEKVYIGSGGIHHGDILYKLVKDGILDSSLMDELEPEEEINGGLIDSETGRCTSAYGHVPKEVDDAVYQWWKSHFHKEAWWNPLAPLQRGPKPTQQMLGRPLNELWNNGSVNAINYYPGDGHPNGDLPYFYDHDSKTLHMATSPAHHYDLLWRLQQAGGNFNPVRYTAGEITPNWMDYAYGIYPAHHSFRGGITHNGIKKFVQTNFAHGSYKNSSFYKRGLTTDEEAKQRVAGGLNQAFGYVNGHLYFGANHSRITSDLIDSGFSWQDLNEDGKIPQIWGNIRKNTASYFVPDKGLDISFYSDDKFYTNHLGDHLKPEATQAIYDWWLKENNAEVRN